MVIVTSRLAYRAALNWNMRWVVKHHWWERYIHGRLWPCQSSRSLHWTLQLYRWAIVEIYKELTFQREARIAGILCAPMIWLLQVQSESLSLSLYLGDRNELVLTMMAPMGSKSSNYLAYAGSSSNNAHQRSLLPPADINNPRYLSLRLWREVGIITHQNR